MTVKELVLESVKDLRTLATEEERKRARFKKKQILQQAQKKDPTLKKASILSTIDRLVIDNPSSPYPPAVRCLKRVVPGTYQILSPEEVAKTLEKKVKKREKPKKGKEEAKAPPPDLMEYLEEKFQEFQKTLKEGLTRKEEEEGLDLQSLILQCRRHERWILKIAEKVGVKLE